MAYRQPTIHLLIGPPGSGKSTWTKRHLDTTEHAPVIVGSDAIIEEIADRFDTTYDQVMRQFDIGNIEYEMNRRFDAALAARQDIIVDRTNLTYKSRNDFLSRVPKKNRPYRRIGVVFRCPEAVLRERLRLRSTTGKSIPDYVVADFLATFEEPDHTQFDQIIEVHA